jgi:hypothetical protein
MNNTNNKTGKRGKVSIPQLFCNLFCSTARGWKKLVAKLLWGLEFNTQKTTRPNQKLHRIATLAFKNKNANPR